MASVINEPIVVRLTVPVKNMPIGTELGYKDVADAIAALGSAAFFEVVRTQDGDPIPPLTPEEIEEAQRAAQRRAKSRRLILGADLDPIIPGPDKVVVGTASGTKQVDVSTIGGDVDPELVAERVTEELAGRDLVEGKAITEEAVAFSVTDADGRRSWVEAGPDGRPTAHAKSILADDLHAPTDLTSDAAIYAVTDQDGRRSWLEVAPHGGPTRHAVSVLAGVLGAGGDEEPASTITQDQTSGSRRLAIRTPDGDTRPFTSRSDIVTFWGDSLFDGYPEPPFLPDGSNTLPGVFAGLVPGATVHNMGSSGQTSGMIAFRQGGLVVNAVPSGGSIPESGSVTLTTDQNIRLRDGIALSRNGTLAGVHGTLAFDTSEPRVLTFTRTTAGSAVPVSEPTPFIPSTPANHAEGIQVIIAGRNDVTFHTGDVVGDVVSATAAMVESLTPRFPRVLLLGTITAVSETIGHPNHGRVVAINAALKALYPQYFWDFRRWLIDEALDVMEITPTADDLDAIAGDTVPPSLMADDRHYTPETAAAAAQRIHDEMTERGWIS